MRRSSLYLGFSIFFMVFAGFVAVKAKRHHFRCQERAAECSVLQLEPEHTRAADELIHQGYVCAMLRDYAQTASFVRGALEQDPNHAEAYCMLGYAQRGLNDFHSAEANYTIAILLAEKDPITHRRLLIDALTGRAAAYIGQGRGQPARLDLDRALNMALQQAQQGKSPGAELYQLACVYSVRSGLHRVDRKLSGTSLSRQVYSDQMEAIDYLKRAQRKNYPDAMHLQGDQDLDPIRSHTRFPTGS